MAPSSHVHHATSGPALAQLLSAAASRKAGAMPYAGEVSPEEVFTYLQSNDAALIDVRTAPEWLQGVPDLARTQGRLVNLSWKTAPDYALNLNFTDELSAEKHIGKDTPLFFMCRGGGRSLDAAAAMTAAGYRYCFNIRGGFEGKPDAPGWKTTLPWKQG